MHDVDDAHCVVVVVSLGTGAEGDVTRMVMTFSVIFGTRISFSDQAAAAAHPAASSEIEVGT